MICKWDAVCPLFCDIRYMCCTSWNIAPPLHTLLNSCPGVTVWLQTRSCRRWAATKQSVLPGWMMPDLLDGSNPTPAHTGWGGNFPSVSIRQHYIIRPRSVPHRHVLWGLCLSITGCTPLHAATVWSNSLVDAEAMFLFKQPPPHTHFNTGSHPLNITPCVCLSILMSSITSDRTRSLLC